MCSLHIWLQVEHEKLKSYHFATDRDSDRTAWVEALTESATLRNDADSARFVLFLLQHQLHCVIRRQSHWYGIVPVSLVIRNINVVIKMVV